MKKKLIVQTGWFIQCDSKGVLSPSIEDQFLVHVGRLIRAFKKESALKLLEKGKRNCLKIEASVFIEE